MSFYEYSAIKMNGKKVNMEEYKGKVVLVVNTASECGFTPQFEGLEELYKKYADKGLAILGFPCNQFGGQDPKDNKDILEFCQINYGVTFDMFLKVKVNGKDAHPLFKFLKEEAPAKLGKSIKWNFTKFLINKDGTKIKRFEPKVKPSEMEEEIKKLL